MKLPRVKTPPPWSILPRKLSDLKRDLNLFDIASTIFILNQCVSPKSFYFLKNVSSQHYQVHPNQIKERKKQLLEHAEEVFSKDRKPDQGPSVKDFHAKIGQLSMENDFLSSALGRIGDASAKQ